MLRDERGMRLTVAMGALGISSETQADLLTDRRATISAPPAEILIAVANSSDSLPFSPRERTNTGIASLSLGHFLCSFLEKVRLTDMPHSDDYTGCDVAS